jgi:hypothetical protein
VRHNFCNIDDLDLICTRDGLIGILVVSHNGIEQDILIAIGNVLDKKHLSNGIGSQFLDSAIRKMDLIDAGLNAG